MLVVIADSISPAVRGRMKIWFIEVKPNVFVSSVKDGIAEKVSDYLFNFCPVESNLVIIKSISVAPYYSIIKKGLKLNYIKEISGFPLIFERNSVG